MAIYTTNSQFPYTFPFTFGGTQALRGSLRAITFTQNATGPMIRKKVKPLRKATAFSTAKRSDFLTNVSNYQNLSPAEKASWSSVRLQYPRVNSLGETYYLNGFQLYTSQNQSTLGAGLPLVPSGSSPHTFPSGTVFCEHYNAPFPAYYAEASIDPVPVDYIFRFWFSRCTSSPGQLVFPTDFKLAVDIPAGNFPGDEYTTIQEQLYGNPPLPSPFPNGPMYWSVAWEIYHIPTGQSKFIDQYQAVGLTA